MLAIVLALVYEAIDYPRQQFTSLIQALTRPSFWGRIRPSFYWTTALSISIVSLLPAGESFWASLARGLFVWVCLRIIEDSVKDPDRYNSVDGFLDWAQRLWHHGALALAACFNFAILAVTAAFALNIVAPGVWRSVGNTS